MLYDFDWTNSVNGNGWSFIVTKQKLSKLFGLNQKDFRLIELVVASWSNVQVWSFCLAKIKQVWFLNVKQSMLSRFGAHLAHFSWEQSKDFNEIVSRGLYTNRGKGKRGMVHEGSMFAGRKTTNLVISRSYTDAVDGHKAGLDPR